MSNIIKFPVIAGIEISTDDQGRFNLNSLHKASGLGKHKSPNKWLANQSTIELIQELDTQTPNLGSALKVNNGGNNSGTFAHELLAISYAGWISPKFQLQVNQTFLDFKSGALQPAQKQLSTLEILEIAIQAEKENIKLTAQVEDMAPKVEALDLIATSNGSMCISNTAKDLQLQPKNLFRWLSVNHWIYKRKGNTTWTAYQDKINQGLLEHKVEPITLPGNRRITTEQVRVTSKGLAKLAYEINKAAA
jgi:phage antirepressor YoqD-like protein